MEKREPFIGVLQSVRKEFTMFLQDGIPVRARLSLTLKEFKMELNEREKTLQSPDKTKVHFTQQGDSLWLIASRVYGNADLWRPIAERNGIKNPRILEPGIKLIIPPLE
jgi:nucleoid-associated protein YgaU